MPHSVRGETDAETLAALRRTADLLTDLGHHVEEMPVPIDEQFAQDFRLYWGFCGWFVMKAGPRVFPGWDPSKADGLTVGLEEYFAQRRKDFPGAVRRLRASKHVYAEALRTRDVVLSPTLSHTTPELGYLSPTVPFDVLFERLRDYAGFTPLNNATGSPAISLPLAQTADGRPLGMHFSAAHEDERTLLELAYELEEARPFARLG